MIDRTSKLTVLEKLMQNYSKIIETTRLLIQFDVRSLHTLKLIVNIETTTQEQ